MPGPRLFVPVTLLLGLVAGCASGTGAGAGEEDVAPAPAPAPEEEREPSGRAVTAEDIERAPNRPIEQLLMSRFPGIVAGRNAEGVLVIRIRGRSTIHGDTEPLYVIDGMTIEPGPGGALFGINPHDIESIEVLSDAISTSMYGVRGANGVVVIETKVPPRPDP